MTIIYAKDGRDLYNKIYQKIAQGVRLNSKRIFDLSKRTDLGYVPVRTGRLKRSAAWTWRPDEWKIAFTAPYAANVELGDTGNNETILKFKPGYTTKARTTASGRYIPSKRVAGKWVSGRSRRRKGRGQRAQRYLWRATMAEMPNLAKDIEEVIK